MLFTKLTKRDKFLLFCLSCVGLSICIVDPIAFRMRSDPKFYLRESWLLESLLIWGLIVFIYRLSFYICAYLFPSIKASYIEKNVENVRTSREEISEHMINIGTTGDLIMSFLWNGWLLVIRVVAVLIPVTNLYFMHTYLGLAALFWAVSHLTYNFHIDKMVGGFHKVLEVSNNLKQFIINVSENYLLDKLYGKKICFDKIINEKIQNDKKAHRSYFSRQQHFFIFLDVLCTCFLGFVPLFIANKYAPEVPKDKIYIMMIMLVGYVWGLGGSLNDSVARLRTILSTSNKSENLTTFDYIEVDNYHIRTEYLECGIEKTLLRIPNMLIKQGEKICVFGKSGIGKSLLLKTIAGFEKPIKGNVFFGNTEIFHKTPTGLIYVAQRNPDILLKFKDSLTLGDYSLLDKAKELLTLFGMTDFINKIEEESVFFSGGEWQRVNIIRAILHNPKVLILDEATSMIDLKQSTKIIKYLQSLEFTLIFVSHRPEEKDLFETIYNAETF